MNAVSKAALYCCILGTLLCLATACNNADVSVNGLKKQVGLVSPAPPTLQIGGFWQSLTNSSYTMSGQVSGKQGTLLSAGGYTMTVEIIK
jgi:hypothetical protein